MKYLNYILIVIGAFVAIYAKAEADQNQMVLILGIVMLMVGVYRISRTVPSRKDGENSNNSEKED